VKRAAALAGAVAASLAPALAQQTATGLPGEKFGAVRQLLVQGYEIKTGFSDNTGGAYLVLQKAASAYLCHSSPSQVCEKLN
jgi:hypothetical protein